MFSHSRAKLLGYVPYPLSGPRLRRTWPDAFPEPRGWRDRLQRWLSGRAIAWMSRAVLP